LGTAAACCLATGVILSTNLIFVGLNELSDHVPKQVHLVAGRRGHRLAKVSQFSLRLLLLILHFVNDLGHVVLNVHEENL